MNKQRKTILLYVGLFISILLLIMLPDLYLLHAHTALGIEWGVGAFALAIPICLVVLCTPWLWLQIPLLSILALVSMLEVLSVFTYYNFINAISFPAFVYANASEMDDMTYYITHFTYRHEILPFILYVCSIILLIQTKKKGWAYSKNHFICLCLSIVCLSVMLLLGNSKLYAHSPYHISREIASALHMRQMRNEHLPMRTNFKYEAEKNDTLTNSLVVLCIGESMNYAHCSFNSQYHRQTTPKLAKTQSAAFYTNYYATATYTEQALPLLLTRATARDFNLNYEELPITSAFKETGFQTFVISNETQIMNNGVDGYLLDGADSVFFVINDANIVHKLHDISKKQGNIFVLLHFSGSHFFYNNYPLECNKWSPNYNHDKKFMSDSLFINSYDNSILYTDSLLSACINGLMESSRNTIFIYTSDHGEYLDEHVGGHGLSCNPTKNEYHVPLMVWYSDEYQTAYPGKVANMIRHKDEPVCADHIFWSVLNMANITIDSTLQQEGMSIFGDTLLPHKRTLLLPDGKSVMDLD